MHGLVAANTVVAATACSVWDVYGSLQVLTIINTCLPNVLGTVKVLQGDGHVGTLLNVTFPPGTPGVGYMKENITKVDNKRRVKETETVEGGFLASGFKRYITQYKVIEKNYTSSIIRSTIKYEIDDKLANLTSLVNTNLVEILAETVGKYLTEIAPSPSPSPSPY
ncbi:norbelladine synthase-like [Mangifera indica]|uniref:norbelladine synthase-like n=1 Tax=Mangifera indica TaxID=29780 RepID=UPI001CFAE821|nr:norbelladine synthase-like [Mangifera indica]